MGLCEAHQAVELGSFVTKHGSLALIHVDSIKPGVQPDYGLCGGVEGWEINGHDAAGNWEWLHPCDWSPVPDPVAFIQRNWLSAQAEFITLHPEVWPELAEQLLPWVEAVKRSLLNDDYSKQVQAKRVGFWEEDYEKNTRHSKPPFNKNF